MANRSTVPLGYDAYKSGNGTQGGENITSTENGVSKEATSETAVSTTDPNTSRRPVLSELVLRPLLGEPGALA